MSQRPRPHTYPTPKQTQDLVYFFGGQRAAARAVGVAESSLRAWLNPEKARAGKMRSHTLHREAARARAKRWAAANPGKIQERDRLRYYALKDAGLCVDCGKPGLSEVRCLDCLTKRTIYG